MRHSKCRETPRRATVLAAVARASFFSHRHRLLENLRCAAVRAASHLVRRRRVETRRRLGRRRSAPTLERDRVEGVGWDLDGVGVIGLRGVIREMAFEPGGASGE